ncbi:MULTISPECIES: hypothetical protein [unclassified Frankia]|uniref:hypothetical protein n=1 Tax=unclassified Frankia TaxID=2632575 RepID=UPI001EF5EBB8|nr:MULTISPECIES: hypothetical protein [unclassified Frankia]
MIQKVSSPPIDGRGAGRGDEVAAGIPVTAERTMSAVTHIHLGHASSADEHCADEHCADEQSADASGGRADGNEVRHAA